MLGVARMRLTALALAAATLPALACSDDADPDAITWRVPCGSVAQWDTGSPITGSYQYNADKRLIQLSLVNSAGVETRHVTSGWEGSHLVWSEGFTEAGPFRSENTWEGDNLVRAVRIDRDLTDGDRGFVFTYTYDARGANTSYDLDFADPKAGDVHGTVTGDRTPRTTQVDCLVSDPTQCDTWVWEQADSDPQHWTAGTADFGGDGTIDYRYDRTLDRHDLELTYVETSFFTDPAGVVVAEFTREREADGTELGYVYQVTNEDGTPGGTYTHTNQFSCAASRVAGSAGGHGVARPVRMSPSPLERLGLDDGLPTARVQ